MIIRSEGLAFSKPLTVGIFSLGFSTFRILELSVDPFFLLHTLPYWGRLRLYWVVRRLVAGFSSFTWTSNANLYCLHFPCSSPFFSFVLPFPQGFVSAYVSFTVVAVVMVEKANRQRKSWVKSFVKASVVFLYYAIGHLVFFGILDITSMAFRDNLILPTVLVRPLSNFHCCCYHCCCCCHR